MTSMWMFSGSNWFHAGIFSLSSYLGSKLQSISLWFLIIWQFIRYSAPEYECKVLKKSFPAICTPNIPYCTPSWSPSHRVSQPVGWGSTLDPSKLKNIYILWIHFFRVWHLFCTTHTNSTIYLPDLIKYGWVFLYYVGKKWELCNKFVSWLCYLKKKEVHPDSPPVENQHCGEISTVDSSRSAPCTTPLLLRQGDDGNEPEAAIKPFGCVFFFFFKH